MVLSLYLPMDSSIGKCKDLNFFSLMLISSSILRKLGECNYSDWRIFKFEFDCVASIV